MKSLKELYSAHQGKVSDKWDLYLGEYDRLFSSYRDKAVCLLEIGVQNGGSLEIWGQYFPKAKKLIGCDINPDCAKLRYDDPRIAVVVGDANTDQSQAEILNLSAQYDVIIDDGSHTSGDIVRSFARYFPYLKDGGLFVAEDLHCSYWQAFEGGLHYPYSSIAFFKRLADVINYEHWGVDKQRSQLLAGISDHFNVDLPDALLSEIHSVEFVNSICIVRKSTSDLNRLGSRFIAGQEELVVTGHIALSDQLPNTVNESGNSWSILDRAPDESFEQLSQELIAANRHLAEQDAQIAALHNSTSWKLTAPLRWGALKIKHLKRLASIAPSALTKARYVYRHEGMAGVRRKLVSLLTNGGINPTIGSDGFDRNDYEEWVRRYDTLDDASRQRIKDSIDTFSRLPKISVVLPVYDPPLKYLDEAIWSVRNQLYPNWELCVADDASRNQAVRNLLARHAQEDARIKVEYRKENGHISAASNTALHLATGEYIALLDHDDLMAEHALFWVAGAILENPDAGLIYSDEDKISESGSRYAPYFKCELNPELLLAQNMICHLGVYRREIVEAVGGFRSGFDGAQDYDLALRIVERLSPKQVIHIPRVLYHWRAIAGSAAMAGDEKSYAAAAGRKAVAAYLRRSGLQAEVSPAPEASDLNRVHFALPSPVPFVSIIIPTRDRVDLLATCINSIFNRSTYPSFEIVIVDNGSVQPKTAEYLADLPKERVKVIRDDAPFNFSRLNNLGARAAQGEILCLMNNDIEILSPDWLEEMVSFACQPDIGCVGTRLWYPDGRMQHGGVILGIGGVAGHSHKFSGRGGAGYFGRAVLHQSYSAVTAACLVVRRTVFEQVDGLDETLAVAFNDVDFCLRIREAGYRNVWTPYAEMIHHESVSRGTEDDPKKQARFQSEVHKMQERWGDKLLNDPAYNPNLTLWHEDFSLAWPPRVDPWPSVMGIHQ